MVWFWKMSQGRESEEFYKREDGLKLLEYLSLLNDDVVGYVKNYFSSMASGKDLLQATRTFYCQTIIQLVQTGEFVPGEDGEKEDEEKSGGIPQSRFNRFDSAVCSRELEQKLSDGIKLSEILENVDISRYITD